MIKEVQFNANSRKKYLKETLTKNLTFKHKYVPPNTVTDLYRLTPN